MEKDIEDIKQLIKGFKKAKEREESKRSNLPSPTPLRFSKAERFDG